MLLSACGAIFGKRLCESTKALNILEGATAAGASFSKRMTSMLISLKREREMHTLQEIKMMNKFASNADDF